MLRFDGLTMVRLTIKFPMNSLHFKMHSSPELLSIKYRVSLSFIFFFLPKIERETKKCTRLNNSVYNEKSKSLYKKNQGNDDFKTHL